MKYLIEIKEELVRHVVVDIGNEEPEEVLPIVEELIEEKCCIGEIDLDFNDFDSRTVMATTEADKIQIEAYHNYTFKNDELV